MSIPPSASVAGGAKPPASEALVFYKITRAPHDAGTHVSGRAGQQFELFDSILGRRVKNVNTHNHSLRVQYVR